MLDKDKEIGKIQHLFMPTAQACGPIHWPIEYISTTVRQTFTFESQSLLRYTQYHPREITQSLLKRHISDGRTPSKDVFPDCTGQPAQCQPRQFVTTCRITHTHTRYTLASEGHSSLM